MRFTRPTLVLAVVAAMLATAPAALAGSRSRDSTDDCSRFGSSGGVITGVSAPSGVNPPSGTSAALVCGGKFSVGRWGYASSTIECSSTSGYPYALTWGPNGLGANSAWSAGWDFWGSSSDLRWDGIAFISGKSGSADSPGTTRVTVHNWDPVRSHDARVWALCGTKANQGDVNGCCMAIWQGTPQPDLLVGTRRSDHLLGRGAADRVLGLAGNDRLEGEAGADTLGGGSGADLLLGGPDGDTLDGGLGFDTLVGGPGNDVLRDSRGPTSVVAGPGNDRVDVQDGAGGDRVTCGIGSDRVMADGGDRVAADCRP